LFIHRPSRIVLWLFYQLKVWGCLKFCICLRKSYWRELMYSL
jgi:hypothetical protein